mgnify:CR=1 FL=1
MGLDYPPIMPAIGILQPNRDKTFDDLPSYLSQPVFNTPTWQNGRVTGLAGSLISHQPDMLHEWRQGMEGKKIRLKI